MEPKYLVTSARHLSQNGEASQTAATIYDRQSKKTLPENIYKARLDTNQELNALPELLVSPEPAISQPEEITHDTAEAPKQGRGQKQ